jgi:hypothetical protein
MISKERCAFTYVAGRFASFRISGFNYKTSRNLAYPIDAYYSPTEYPSGIAEVIGARLLWENTACRSATERS